jgi:ubiquinone/menaquinone biosynthesis C-methylase UbiE
MTRASDTPRVAPDGAAPMVTIPPEVVRIATEQLGAFFEPVSRIDRRALAADFLDARKSQKRAALLEQYVPLRGKTLLEIGSGYGTNLAEWIKRFGIDGHGVEPGNVGFDSGIRASRLLFEANGLDPDRIKNASGEALPFGDESFDIVYSANVLEHTADPERVVAEALRVLKPGGIFHMEMPNFLSYFEGHYMVVQPPLLWKWMLPAWVRLFGRDPAFARTLNTEVNPNWCLAVAKRLQGTYDLTVLSLGEEAFVDRLSRRFDFETAITAGQLGRIMSAVRVINVRNWIGHSIVALRGHYPIYFTMRKNAR